MSNFQNTAGMIAKKYNLDAPAMARFVDLVSEIGELGKELLLGSGYGNEEQQITDNTKEEMGDVAFALALLANALSLDLDECFAASVAKYEKRWAKNGQK